MRRALSGLALFVCLLASGWAWQQFASGPDVEGDYIRTTIQIEREDLCDDTSGDVPEGIMRVGSATVTFHGRECLIAGSQQVTREGTEFALTCSPVPGEPEGFEALLTIRGTYAEFTSDVEAGSNSHVEARSVFLLCEDAVRLGPPNAIY